jgi:CSLREA domain-containing protein
MSAALRAALVAGLFAIIAFAPTCEAASFQVTRFDDPVPDGCAVDDCSLREAVLAANALPGADTVRLSTGRYFLEQRGIDENEGLIGDIDITDDLTLLGNGRDATSIDSRSVDYVFEIASGVSLTVRQLGIVNVSLDLPVEQQAGGGIRGGYFGAGNPWTTRLVLEDFLLDASTDLFASIHLRGSLSSTRATFRNAIRRSPSQGQAVRVMGPSTTIRDSEFLNNVQALSVSGPDGASEVPLRISDTRFVGGGGADVYCPAIETGTDAGVLQRVSVSGFSTVAGWAVVCGPAFGSLSIRESSFFDNASAAISVGHLTFPSRVDIYNSTIDGSAILVDIRGTLSLSNSTVTAAPGGYALDVLRGGVESINSIVVGTCRVREAAIQTRGANFEGPGDTCFPHTGFNFANLTAEQLDLGPLADNGGPTPTRLPSSESVLLDHTSGTAALCETIDQRGFIRPRPCTAGAADPLAVDDAVFIDGLDL